MKISVKMCRKKKRAKSKWGRTRDLIQVYKKLHIYDGFVTYGIICK